MKAVLLLLATLLAPPAFAAGYGQYGPFDFYDPPKGSRALVESEHFGPKTELFLMKKDFCRVWGDYDYTLRAFPNHPHALVKMADFLDRHSGCQPSAPENQSVADLVAEIEKGTWREHNADYYFKKGIEFAPQHAETRMLYGRYLFSKNRLDEAVRQLLDAEKIDPKSADIQYHLGKAYLAKGDSTKALGHARRAYQQGKPPEDLKQQLVEAGKWK